MTRKQFSYLAGFFLVWLAWEAGWVVLAAVAAGIIGLLVVQALEGDIDLAELSERFRSSSSSSSQTRRP